MSAVWSFFADMFVYTLIATFLENTIFSRALGASTSLWVIRKKYSIMLFGLVMTLITTLSSLGAYFAAPLLAKTKDGSYWMPFFYVCIIGIVYVVLLLVVNRFQFKMKDMLLVFIHRCSFNCAVLGAMLLVTSGNLKLGGSIGFGIGTGLGFTFATYMTYIAYERLNDKKIPKSFRGFPITLFYIGILSLAVYGMIGHELPI